nr:BLTX523 [Nephila pilipes]
MAERSC